MAPGRPLPGFFLPEFHCELNPIEMASHTVYPKYISGDLDLTKLYLLVLGLV